MRLLSTFLCVFLLTLFSGTLTYVYIIWNSYWSKVAKTTAFEEVLLNKKQNQRQLNLHQASVKAIPKVRIVPKISNIKEQETEMNLPPDKLWMHVRHYKTQIISQLRSAVISAGKSVQDGEIKNVYGVKYKGKRASKLKPEKNPEELVCSGIY